MTVRRFQQEIAAAIHALPDLPPANPNLAAEVRAEFDRLMARVGAVEHATLGTPAHDDEGMVKAWTEDAMLRVLWRHFTALSWAAIPQVTVSEHDLNGVPQVLAPGAPAERRIDLLLARVPRTVQLGDLETVAVEVKVSRADFFTDVRNPAKQAAWRRAATRHAYAVPAGLVTADEVPEGSGLLAVKHAGTHGWGTVEWVRRAPYRDGHTPPLPRRVLMSLLHRITGLEGHTRGWHTGPDAAGTTQELRAALAAAHRAVEKAEMRAVRAEGQKDAWRAAHALAVPAGHPCRWCGNPLKPLNPKVDWFKRWRHTDAGHDAPCVYAEQVYAESEARAAYDTADYQERARHLRYAHRVTYQDALHTEPWRAFMRPADDPRPPEPADMRPEGD